MLKNLFVLNAFAEQTRNGLPGGGTRQSRAMLRAARGIARGGMWG